MVDILEKEIKKFNIDPKIKSTNTKYLTKDERWSIIFNFFNLKKAERMIANRNDGVLIFHFKSKEEAKLFSENPSDGLLSYSRKFLKEKNKNPLEYDLFFNLSIIYDDRQNNKKANVVTIRILQ